LRGPGDEGHQGPGRRQGRHRHAARAGRRRLTGGRPTGPNWFLSAFGRGIGAPGPRSRGRNREGWEAAARESGAVPWTPRLIRPDELPAVIDLIAVGFGAGPVAPPDLRAASEAVAEVDRTFVVEDEGRLVGTAAAYSFNLAVPGGTVPMAAVTQVAVSPTHRRRGLLTALLEAVHDQAVERGEPLAGLTASEG